MHLQIFNFHLEGMNDEAYRALCDELAPAFAAVPGLRSKVWLADRAGNTYGGVYVWESRDAMNQFAASELCSAVVNHPNLAGIRSIDFEVLEAPTRVTRGWSEAA